MKAAIVIFLLSPFLLAQVKPSEVSTFAAKLGPAIGAQAPIFEVKDNVGKAQSLMSLRGPKGLILLFIRSADW